MLRTQTPSPAAALLVAALALGALARQPSVHEGAALPVAAAKPPRPPASPASTEGTARLRRGRGLDLNRATAGDLRLLPRIGPRLAQRIIEDRARRGRFESVEALTRVRGIGGRTLDQLRELVAVEPQSPNSPEASPANRTLGSEFQDALDGEGGQHAGQDLARAAAGVERPHVEPEDPLAGR